MRQARAHRRTSLAARSWTTDSAAANCAVSVRLQHRSIHLWVSGSRVRLHGCIQRRPAAVRTPPRGSFAGTAVARPTYDEQVSVRIGGRAPTQQLAARRLRPVVGQGKRAVDRQVRAAGALTALLMERQAVALAAAAKV